MFRYCLFCICWNLKNRNWTKTRQKKKAIENDWINYCRKRKSGVYCG